MDIANIVIFIIGVVLISYLALLHITRIYVGIKLGQLFGTNNELGTAPDMSKIIEMITGQNPEKKLKEKSKEEKEELKGYA